MLPARKGLRDVRNSHEVTPARLSGEQWNPVNAKASKNKQFFDKRFTKAAASRSNFSKQPSRDAFEVDPSRGLTRETLGTVQSTRSKSNANTSAYTSPATNKKGKPKGKAMNIRDVLLDRQLKRLRDNN